MEVLGLVLEDLDELAPEVGEEEKLSGLRGRLMNREKVLNGLNAAHAVLNAEDDPIRKAMGALDRIADKKVVHKNKASRHKSRLSAKIKALAA